jgi:hypothetical protein
VPLDTAEVELDGELSALVELLAAHVHDVWGRRRLHEGWRHGARRDEARREHPGLVPYDQLPEGEKEYDRQTVAETLKAVIALGYRIAKGP